jgi:hypothetical protein
MDDFLVSFKSDFPSLDGKIGLGTCLSLKEINFAGSLPLSLQKSLPRN